MADVAPRVVEQLRHALNEHDLDGLVSCFSKDYVNETPAHPQRSFRGQGQVRRNWTQIFGGVPNVRAEILRISVDGATVWTEWELAGRRVDGAPFLMRGVVIFTLAGPAISRARFYLEPVEESSGDVDMHARRVSGALQEEPS